MAFLPVWRDTWSFRCTFLMTLSLTLQCHLFNLYKARLAGFGWVLVSAILKFILKEVFQQPLWDCPDLDICFFSNFLGSSEFPLHIFAACCYTTPTQKYNEMYGVEFLNSWYINHVPFCWRELLNMLVRLMKEILNHLGCMKPCKWWG